MNPAAIELLSAFDWRLSDIVVTPLLLCYCFTFHWAGVLTNRRDSLCKYLRLPHCACFVWQNEKGLCPADVVPDPLDMPLEMADAAAMAKELRALLRQALPRPSSPLPFTLQAQSLPALSEKAKAQLASMGIRMGDCVVIAGQKVCYRSTTPSS